MESMIGARFFIVRDQYYKYGKRELDGFKLGIAMWIHGFNNYYIYIHIYKSLDVKICVYSHIIYMCTYDYIYIYFLD
jgi:hypothetical protein